MGDEDVSALKEALIIKEKTSKLDFILKKKILFIKRHHKEYGKMCAKRISGKEYPEYIRMLQVNKKIEKLKNQIMQFFCGKNYFNQHSSRRP